MASRRERRENAHPWLLRTVIVAIALMIAFYVRSRIGDAEYRIIQEPQRLTLLDDDPLEPLEEQIELEPETQEDAVQLQESEATDQDADESAASAGDVLGLDATGVAGSDAFGLAARRGGRNLLESGNGSSLGCEWYASALTSELHERLLPLLEERGDLRRSAYSVIMRLWLAPDGRVTRYTVTSTGDAGLDRQLRSAMQDFERVTTPPPADMPQPVRVRLRCRT